MLRVDSSKQNSRTIIRIAGRLESRHLAELETECEAAESKVTLDLSELQSADPEAIRCLRRWQQRGERIVGESPYIRFLLERAQGDTDQ